MKNIFSNFLLLALLGCAFPLNAQTIESGNIYSSTGQIVAIYTLNHPSCFNTATGIVSLELMNDSYTVEWIDGSNNTTFKQLYAGDYTFKILTGNTEIFYKVSLQQPDQLSGSISQIKTNNTYTLDLEVEGGVSPYIYLWNNGAESQDLNDITEAGIYQVDIVDKNNCALTLKSQINRKIKPSLDLKN